MKLIYNEDWTDFENLKPEYCTVRGALSNAKLALIANDFLKRPGDDLLKREAIRGWRNGFKLSSIKRIVQILKKQYYSYYNILDNLTIF